jgi:probable phosphoglycerate mutase
LRPAIRRGDTSRSDPLRATPVRACVGGPGESTRDSRGEAIGVATNNVAEYRALLAGLERALELGLDEIEVVSDSELLVKQMRGEYKVKNAALRELSVEAARLARKIGKVAYTSVPREHNELADRLVNEALDRELAGR